MTKFLFSTTCCHSFQVLMDAVKEESLEGTRAVISSTPGHALLSNLLKQGSSPKQIPPSRIPSLKKTSGGGGGGGGGGPARVSEQGGL